MGFSSAKTTSQATTTTISDSYNKTTNFVSNLSDVGNTNISLPGSTVGNSDKSPVASTPVLLAGAVVVALILFRKK